MTGTRRNPTERGLLADLAPLFALPPRQRVVLVEELASFLTPRRLARIDAVLANRTRHVTMVCEDVYHPHNASAVLRTCECFGVQDVHVVEGLHRFRPSTDVVRGAARWLTIQRWRHREGDDISTCLASLKARGYRIAATAPGHSGETIADLDLAKPVALCFGTEETGLSPALQELADVSISVPMHGFTQSLNVSVTAALCLWDLTSRLRRSSVDWPLSAEARDDLRLAWLATESPRARAHVATLLAPRTDAG